jgi:p-aminobenzoyl-glutamate transporter AbgT
MNVFNPLHLRSAWTYLTNGNPPPILLFAVANGVLLVLFLYFRAKKAPVDYKRTRYQLQILTVLANTAIIFGEAFMATLQNGFAPLRGLLNFI